MELTQLLNHTAKVSVSYQGFAFGLTVFTERLTPQYKSHLLSVLSASEQIPEGADAPVEVKEEHALMLSDLIESWDVTKNEEPWPASYENLIQLSYQCLAVLTREISQFLGELANPQNGQA